MTLWWEILHREDLRCTVGVLEIPTGLMVLGTSLDVDRNFWQMFWPMIRKKQKKQEKNLALAFGGWQRFHPMPRLCSPASELQATCYAFHPS